MITYNGKVVKSQGGSWLYPSRTYTLPPYTLRLRYAEGETPPSSLLCPGTFTRVSGVSGNVWDWTYENSDWSSPNSLVGGYLGYVVEVIDCGDLYGVKKFDGLFSHSPVVVVNHLDLYGATSVNSLFYLASNLSQVPEFFLTNCTDARNMFVYCTSLESVHLKDTDCLEQTGASFASCSSLVEVTLTNTSRITNASDMFGGDTSLKHFGFSDLSSVTTMTQMFANCTSLEEIPTFDLSSVKLMQSAFYNCSSLRYIPPLVTPVLEDAVQVFMGCVNVTSGALDFYNQANDTVLPGWHSGAFTDCGSNTTTGAAELAQIPSSWGGTGP